MIRFRFNELSLPCDKVARFDDGTLAVVSVACGRREGAAFKSEFKHNKQAQFKAVGLGFLWSGMEKDPDGYSVYSAKIHERWWHCLAISKRPGFFPCVSHKGLWIELQKYTTPVCQEWIRWLGQELISRGHLQNVNGHGVKPGLLTITQPELDEVVSYGVRRGVLQIPVPAV